MADMYGSKTDKILLSCPNDGKIFFFYFQTQKVREGKNSSSAQNIFSLAKAPQEIPLKLSKMMEPKSSGAIFHEEMKHNARRPIVIVPHKNEISAWAIGPGAAATGLWTIPLKQLAGNHEVKQSIVEFMQVAHGGRSTRLLFVQVATYKKIENEDDKSRVARKLLVYRYLPATANANVGSSHHAAHFTEDYSEPKLVFAKRGYLVDEIVDDLASNTEESNTGEKESVTIDANGEVEGKIENTIANRVSNSKYANILDKIPSLSSATPWDRDVGFIAPSQLSLILPETENTSESKENSTSETIFAVYDLIFPSPEVLNIGSSKARAPRIDFWGDFLNMGSMRGPLLMMGVFAFMFFTAVKRGTFTTPMQHGADGSRFADGGAMGMSRDQFTNHFGKKD